MTLLKKLLLILLLGLPFIVAGQNWLPSGAIWYYGFGISMDDGYYKIEYIGDTSIASVPCKKLKKTRYIENRAFQTFDTTIIGTEYTYADANKVYIYKHNLFYTLYDFSAQAGATWIVPEISHYSGCDTTGIIRVDSAGSIKINNKTLRYVCVSPADKGQYWGWSAKIVERIGPIKSFSSNDYNYLFPVNPNYCEMLSSGLLIEGGNLRCYTDNEPFSYISLAN